MAVDPARGCGHRLDGFLAGTYRFTMDHQFPLVGVMAAIISAYPLASGIARLAGAGRFAG